MQCSSGTALSRGTLAYYRNDSSMNPEGERMVDERREAEIREAQSNIRAGIDTAPAIPSRVYTFEVRGGEVIAFDPDTGKEL